MGGPKSPHHPNGGTDGAGPPSWGGSNPHVTPTGAQIEPDHPRGGEGQGQGDPEINHNQWQRAEKQLISHPSSLNSTAPQHSHPSWAPPDPSVPNRGAVGGQACPPPAHPYLILGLQCLKNWRNLGIMTLRGRLSASLSRSSEESSQIFCRAPNAPCVPEVGGQCRPGRPPSPRPVPAHLAGVVVLRVEQVAELRQQLRPHLQLPLGGDGGDEDACGGFVSAGGAGGPRGSPPAPSHRWWPG